MLDIFLKILLVIGAYLLGSIPVAYIIFKVKKGGDIRNEGSGNVGGTNITRTIGAGAGAFTIFLDVLKGFLPVMASYLLFGPDPVMLAISSVAAVLGHDYPVFLNFRGGKGISSSFGVIIGFCSFPFFEAPVWLRILPLFIIVGVWGLVFLITRIVSVSSLSAAVAFPLAFFFCGYPLPIVIAAILLSILTMVAHRDNIRRIIRKEEKKLKRKGA